MMNRWVIAPLRRLTQMTTLALVVLLPLLALYSHYKQAHAIADLPDNQWRTKAIREIDKTVADDPQRAKWVQETQGTLWSARIGGVSLSDPLAGVEAIVSSRSLYQPMLWSLLIPVAATVLLGRVFCGWFCPMNTLLEVVDKGRRVLRWLEIRDRDVRFSLRNKYVVLGLSLLIVAVAGMPFLALVYPPAVISREVHLWIFGGAFGLGVYLILLIAAFELFVSRRWWCRYVCPGGALYSLLGRFRLIRVRRDTQKCVRCGDCVKICQFDLRPMLVETTGMECTNCGSCIRGCDSDALSYRFVLPLPVIAKPAALPKNADAPKQFVVMLLAGIVALAGCSAVYAHHILGLPHYSYKENYPQAPTLEYPAKTGPYDVLMTSYPGKPVPGEPATITFYIKNRNTNEVYAKPVTVRVLQTATFGANTVVYGPETHPPFDNQHKFTITFPSDAEYIVELTMQVEGREEVIPFLMVAGEPSAGTSIVVLLAASLVVFIIAVRAIKIKRQRRRQSQQTAVSMEAV
ncbi:MAG: hypothetical protein KatS3mg105_3513 [Gemmatales bacterium]|nr:MAG: hypothetical protein KatS3mg105_3513 [Gemmatales bacterium]